MNLKNISLFIFLNIFNFGYVFSMVSNLKKLSKLYVPITILSPGQLRFTQQNVDTKAKKLMKSKGIHDNGKSSLSLNDAVPVILGPDNLLILVDSHHELLAAKTIGDETAPIEVKDDLSNLSKEEFFKVAKEKNYIYPFDKIGNEVSMPDQGWFKWDLMEDDPNRLFASLVAWKYYEINKGYRDPNASEDPEFPLWRKNLNEKVKLAFIEFKIATILYKAGLEFNYNWGVNPNSEIIKEFTEKARKVLNQALENKQIVKFDLINERRHFSLLNK